ncbi:type III secretion system inner membrane ring lipoprotein SctJ [Bradyrhizobium sp. B120]|uniref:type III secretion system inner membrane ring lipoprotein SctJ n=1 Tax=Bradyrhizobium sp. B120 TaxID=3410088 RepID=UPI003B9829F7
MNNRYASVVLVLMRAMILFATFALAGCGAKIELYRNLPARDANEMLALLMRHGIDAERVAEHSGAAALVVSTKDVPRAMSVLGGAGLPRDRLSDLGTLFKKEGMLSSPTEERVRFIHGTTQELSETLSRIDGVLSARVHAVLPENTIDDRVPPSPSTAAVLVRYKAGTAVDQIVPKIKELVANSLKGVSYDGVSVTLVEATQNDNSERPLDAPPVAAETSAPPYLLAGLVAAIAISLIGNAALAFLVWWKRVSRTANRAAP